MLAGEKGIWGTLEPILIRIIFRVRKGVGESK
jgi:hypothetical protein